MTIARAHLVDVEVTRWYHCITRCVRRAFLLSEAPLDRKQWIENRLRELSEIFAISVGGFSVMSSREGMLEGLSLGSYLLVVDYTRRLFREGKAAISAEVFGILHRIGISLDEWRARLERLRGGRLFGRFFAGSRERLRAVAARLRVHHLANLGACPAR